MKNSIYTPNNKPTFREIYNVGDELKLEIGGIIYFGIVTHFPKNSANDTDSRMCLEPLSDSFIGRMTISEENNWYGSYHISEVTINKLSELNRLSKTDDCIIERD